MPSDLDIAIRKLRACAEGIPASMAWAEVPFKIGEVTALLDRLDQLTADRKADRDRLATLTEAAELHRPESRDRHGEVTHDPVKAVLDWWCRQCARRVKAAGCGTWKAAGLS